MINSRNLIEDLLPNTIFCRKKEVIDALMKSGMAGSLDNAYKIAACLPWKEAAPGKTDVITRETAIKFFIDRM